MGVAQAVIVQVKALQIVWHQSGIWMQRLHQAAQSDFGLNLDDEQKMHAGTQPGSPNVGKRCIVYVLDTRKMSLQITKTQYNQ